MAVQGWPTNDLSSTSALLLHKRVESGCQELTQLKMLKASKKEHNQKRSQEQRNAAEESRQQRQATQEEIQAAAQLRREIRQQRVRDQEAAAEERREERRWRLQEQELAHARKIARRDAHESRRLEEKILN